MTELNRVLATTGIVQQGGSTIEITKEALGSMAEQVAGSLAFPVNMEHDPSFMPIGKIKDAWLEPLGNEFALRVLAQIEEPVFLEAPHRPNEVLVLMDFADNPKPFFMRGNGESKEGALLLSVDLANFDGIHQYSKFETEVALATDDIVVGKGVGRHSAVPFPFVDFVASYPEMALALTWVFWRGEKFVRYLVDETLRKVADDLSESLSAKIKRVLHIYHAHRSADDRPCLAQVNIPGDTAIVLLFENEAGQEFPPIRLAELMTEMEKYADILPIADSATFLWNEKDGWQFRYMTTPDGKAIGKVEAYPGNTVGHSFEEGEPDDGQGEN